MKTHKPQVGIRKTATGWFFVWWDSHTSAGSTPAVETICEVAADAYRKIKIQWPSKKIRPTIELDNLTVPEGQAFKAELWKLGMRQPMKHMRPFFMPVVTQEVGFSSEPIERIVIEFTVIDRAGFFEDLQAMCLDNSSLDHSNAWRDVSNAVKELQYER